MSTPRKYASTRQIMSLVEYMFENREVANNRIDVANNRIDSAQGRIECDNAWENITLKLNAMGGGAIKTTDKWKQTWRDLKSNVKKKVVKGKKDHERTGGGVSVSVPLTDIEEKVAAILGGDAIMGMFEVAEIVPSQEVGQESQEVYEIPVDPSSVTNSGTLGTSGPQTIPTGSSAGTSTLTGTAMSTILQPQTPSTTFHPTSWSERRLAQRQKKRRTLGNIEERFLKLEEEKFRFEKQYKLEKLRNLKRIANAQYKK